MPLWGNSKKSISQVHPEALSLVNNKIYYGYNKQIKDYGILFCDGYL